ncbi:MAG TPA: efflux RND transporter permease subunit [Planctomycetota bacterium]|nr:efflux RND transporter permease subunit [Planctomycetota bacterium]
MNLPEIAIRRPVTMLMLLLSLAVLGGVSLTRLPLASRPDDDEPEIFARFSYPNASPEQVEEMIIRPAEDVLGSVKGLKQMYSRCDDDGGSIRMEFDWSANLHLARVDVWEKIERIRRDLPEDIEDITVSENWDSREADDPVIEARLSSALDLSESYDVLERRIVRPLQRVPGVAQVRLDGVSPKEVHINLRVAALELHNMDVREVTRILRGSNFDQSLGRIRAGDFRYTVRTVGTFRTVQEIRDLVLRSDGLRLSDIADVTYAEPELEFGRHLDGKVAVGLTVSAESQANVVELCDALERKIAELDRDPELRGVRFLVRMSQGREIKQTLMELLSSGLFGATFAAVVLYSFLRRVSATLVSVSSIPFSLIVTCGVLWVQGGTLNTMSLLGLIVGVGMLVDNAVVVIENISRHQELGRDRVKAALLGSREVSTAVVAATLTSVIVFLPVVFNKPSRLNIPLKEIGVTVCLTLLASLFISQTLIPLATSRFIFSRPPPRPRWMVWLEKRYVRVLGFNLRHRWLPSLIGLAVIGSALYPYHRVEVNFDSGEGSSSAQVAYHFSEEASMDRKEEVISHVEACLEPHRAELLAKSIYSWWSDSHAMTRIYVEDGLADEENVERVRGLLRELLPEIPGVRLEVTDRRRSWHQDRGKRIAFQILGDDSGVLARLGEEARGRLHRVPGLTSRPSSDRSDQQELRVEIDRGLAARHGVSPEQLSERVGLTFRGRRLQRFRTSDGEREMRLTLDEQEAESLSQLTNLPMWNVREEKVPLAVLADFRQTRSPERIERDDRLKSMWVSAEYREGTREQHLPRVIEVLSAMEFPEGYSWSMSKWEARRRESSEEFMINLGLALLLVFTVMAGLFESVSRAVALMIALPFALAGAIWTLYLTGTDFNQPAAVGLLLLIGIVVNNGIVMIEHISGYERAGMRRLRAMLKGGRERLRPILMTTLTTLFGLVPMVVQRPSLGDVSYYSMALVLMGGLAVSTILTTILLPTTATLVEDATRVVGRRMEAMMGSRRGRVKG